MSLLVKKTCFEPYYENQINRTLFAGFARLEILTGFVLETQVDGDPYSIQKQQKMDDPTVIIGPIEFTGPSLTGFRSTRCNQKLVSDVFGSVGNEDFSV